MVARQTRASTASVSTRSAAIGVCAIGRTRDPTVPLGWILARRISATMAPCAFLTPLTARSRASVPPDTPVTDPSIHSFISLFIYVLSFSALTLLVRASGL